MRIAVSGSIATDHLMTFGGKFTDTLIAEKLDKISVSFLVGNLEIRRGGVAGNIAYGLGCLGLKPLLVGCVGPDFADYRGWLEDHGVDTSGVRTSATRQTARFTATNDESGNQIASFYPGAMSEDGEIDITSLAAANGVELVLIGAGDPGAMQQHTADCRAAGIPFAADFSQQVAFLDGDAMRTLIEGAAYLFCNEYEAAVIESKTGWTSEDILARVGTRIITLGSEGARVERQGADPIVVGAVKDATFVEPTGAGDAFRCGFLAATSWGLSIERAVQLGNLMAVHALETVGPQEYDLNPALLADRAGAPTAPRPPPSWPSTCRPSHPDTPPGERSSPGGASAFITSIPSYVGLRTLAPVGIRARAPADTRPAAAPPRPAPAPGRRLRLRAPRQATPLRSWMRASSKCSVPM